jgi:ribonuclease-3
MSIVTTEKGAVLQDPPSYGDKCNYYCDLKLLDDLPVFRGWGASKSEARMNVCRAAYKHLIETGEIELRSIRGEIDKPTKEFAINQLEILSRRDYFPMPTYNFDLEYDKNGNPIWQCSCSIAGYKPQHGEKSSSKRDAKKSAALKMLLQVLDDDDKRRDKEGYK